ncbi:hypothetical protein LTR53_000290 [Teratosphaeriaceae sp. CCFEE 6253]|nr:hypothetical protein LTR53_000290 [Teratosphaeriaceae sp. CCFEE 6253]
MPTYRSLAVSVTDKHDRPLREHGARTHDRAHLSRCHIQSETGMAFRISIAPVLPFSTFEHGDSSELAPRPPPRPTHRRRAGDRVEDRLGEMANVYAWPETFDRRIDFDDIYPRRLREHAREAAKHYEDPSWASHLLHIAEFDRRYRTEALECLEDFARDHHRGTDSDSDGAWTSEDDAEAPWHLMAILRLDGRRTFEKRSIIYCDERHPRFRWPSGESRMTQRTVCGPDGAARECGWYFSEVGIDSILDNLLLSSESDAVPTQDDADLLQAFGGLGANGLEDAEAEGGSVGQIEITFERVTVGQVKRNVPLKPDDGEDDGEAMAVDATKASHVAARDAGKKRETTHDIIHYEPVVPGEPPFATFRFYYANEAKLRKLYPADFQPLAAKSGQTLKQRKTAMSSLVPLSITAAKLPKYIFDREGNLIAEVDIPKAPKAPMLFGAAKSSGDSSDTDKASDDMWKPVDSQVPRSHKKPVKLPDSPLNDSPDTAHHAVGSAIGLIEVIDADVVANIEGMSGSGFEQQPAQTAVKTSALPTVQAPVQQSPSDTPASGLPSDKLVTGFRRMSQEGVNDDDDADDEASQGNSTPDSLLAVDSSAAGDEQDTGVARDGDDGGIGERLTKVVLGKRRVGRVGQMGEEEDAETRVKKVKTEVPDGEQQDGSLLSEQSADVESAAPAVPVRPADMDEGEGL